VKTEEREDPSTSQLTTGRKEENNVLVIIDGRRQTLDRATQMEKIKLQQVGTVWVAVVHLGERNQFSSEFANVTEREVGEAACAVKDRN